MDTSQNKTESEKTVLVDKPEEHKSIEQSDKGEEAGESNVEDDSEPEILEDKQPHVKETRKGILLDDSLYQDSSFDLNYEDVTEEEAENQEKSDDEMGARETQELYENNKNYEDEHSRTDISDEPSVIENHKGVLNEDTTYIGSSFEISYESDDDEDKAEEQDILENGEEVSNTCKFQDELGDDDDDDGKPCKEEGKNILILQELAASNEGMSALPFLQELVKNSMSFFNSIFIYSFC